MYVYCNLLLTSKETWFGPPTFLGLATPLVLGPTNFIGITITATARMTAWMKNEDFYRWPGTGPLEKFYLFYLFIYLFYLIFNLFFN